LHLNTFLFIEFLSYQSRKLSWSDKTGNRAADKGLRQKKQCSSKTKPTDKEHRQKGYSSTTFS
jgi:hypothetical protein